MELLDLKGLTPKQIERFCVTELGQKPGRGLVIARYLFKHRVEDIDAVTEINRALREGLKSRCRISSISVERQEQAEDGTGKLLYRLEDGNTIEGVLIPGPRERLTLCVSSQVGCASGCGFCLTGTGGLVRNLTTAEMVNQVLAASRAVAGREITNIVLMGTGEPLSNYDAVRSFVETATDRHGMGYSGKKVTVSTCGIAPMIEKLANDGVDASLAVSLNATTDEMRSRIMPVNKSWPIARLMESLRRYADRTGRTVTIEYVLFKGVNDSLDDARRLADLLDGLPCMINLLLFNPFPGASFERPEAETLSLFRDILVTREYITVVRSSRGRDISAACGQLRASAGPVMAGRHEETE